jgi:hypothetical protein
MAVENSIVERGSEVILADVLGSRYKTDGHLKASHIPDSGLLKSVVRRGWLPLPRDRLYGGDMNEMVTSSNGTSFEKMGYQVAFQAVPVSIEHVLG